MHYRYFEGEIQKRRTQEEEWEPVSSNEANNILAALDDDKPPNPQPCKKGSFRRPQDFYYPHNQCTS